LGTIEDSSASRALGRAKGEFSKAVKEQNDAEAKAASRDITTRTETLKSKEELLVETAQKLGISTAGKTREELTQEISMKVDLLAAD
jgi:Sec-independent protein translocase protein TatA